MLTDAAKKQGAKVVEAEEKIKTWLKYSGDRNGGRKKRATEKGTQALLCLIKYVRNYYIY